MNAVAVASARAPATSFARSRAPSAPAQLSVHKPRRAVNKVLVVKKKRKVYVFAANDSDGLLIVDITRPDRPAVVGQWPARRRK